MNVQVIGLHGKKRSSGIQFRSPDSNHGDIGTVALQVIKMKETQTSPIIAELCSFQDKAMEALYCTRRRLAMAPIVRIWALFGTASVLATMLRREYNIWLINCGLILQAARFLALRRYARTGSSSLVSLLCHASFPARAALLLTCGYYFSEVQQSLELLIPLFAVYDAVLFPFIEQVRVAET